MDSNFFPRLALYPLIKSTYNLFPIYAIKLKNAILIDATSFYLFDLSQTNRDKIQTGIVSTTKQICLQIVYACTYTIKKGKNAD